MNRCEETRMIPINAQVLKPRMDRAWPAVLDESACLNVRKARGTRCGDSGAMAEETRSQPIYAPGYFDFGERISFLIAVVLRFVRAFDRHAEIIRLLLGQH